MSVTREYDSFEKRLLNDFQRGFPLSSRPFAALALQLGVTESEVIDALRSLHEQGTVSRVGAVFRPHRVGTSTLAAMAVPQQHVEAVAALINGYAQVNHNYEREHDYNLWFVVTAAHDEELDTVLSEIAQRSGFSVLSLPLLDDYHIDLGFDLQWDE
jgi:DNA-binding Lrp family transcriptional regulator